MAVQSRPYWRNWTYENQGFWVQTCPRHSVSLLWLPLCLNFSIWKVKAKLTSHKGTVQGSAHIYGALKLLDDERCLYLKCCPYTPTICHDLWWHILTSTSPEEDRSDFFPDLTPWTLGSSSKAESSESVAAALTARLSHQDCCSDGLASQLTHSSQPEEALLKSVQGD